MLYIGICKNCYPKIAIIGWANRNEAWQGTHHTGHPDGLVIMTVDKIPMLAEQVSIEMKLFRIAKEGGYIDIGGKAHYDHALNDIEIRPAILALIQELNNTIERTKAYLTDTYKDRIRKLCQPSETIQQVMAEPCSNLSI